MTLALKRAAHFDEVSGLAKLSTLGWSVEVRYRPAGDKPAPWDSAYEIRPRDVAYWRWRGFSSPLCPSVFNLPAGFVLSA